MANILFVSIAFPPKNDPECIQSARYFKYLSKDDDWKVDVVTSSSPTLFMPEDAGLKKYDTGFRLKIEIALFESKYLNFVLRKLGLNKVLFPDSKMTFHWQWRKVLKQLKIQPDIIYSRSNPMSSALMAWKLKRYFNVPWVMHMSDPWALSPLNELPSSMKKKTLEVEESLLQEVDKVTFTSMRTLNLYAGRYPSFASRFFVMPNVYDPEDLREVPWTNSGKLRIVYTGGLSGKRNVFFLDQVMRAAALQNPELVNWVEFIFAGDMDRDNRSFFENERPWLSHRGILSHAEAQDLCESACILMVVDNPTMSKEAIFFPSKLLDYFLVKRMIWAVSPTDSFTRELLQKTNHVSFERDEIEGMATFLVNAVRQFKNGEVSVFQSNYIPEEFNAEVNAKILSGRLKEIIG